MLQYDAHLVLLNNGYATCIVEVFYVNGSNGNAGQNVLDMAVRIKGTEQESSVTYNQCRLDLIWNDSNPSLNL